MAQAGPKIGGVVSKEPSSAGTAILECSGSTEKSTAVTFASIKRRSGQIGRSLAAAPHVLGPPNATTEGRLVAALDKALEAIAPPVFVITCDGGILRSNAPARLLLAQEAAAVGQSLGRAVSHRAADSAWDLQPLGNDGDPAGFLAIYRPPSRTKSIAQALPKARRAWKLTARQMEVLDLVAKGLTNDLIAEQLMIGKGTVEFHLSAIFDKAGVSNRATLIVRLLDL